MARRLWFKLPIGASQWSVFVADPDDPDLQDPSNPEGWYEGRSLYDECVILVCSGVHRTRRPEVLVHEMLHAVSHVLGLQESLRMSERREEQIWLALTPAVTHALVGSKILRLPRVRSGE